MQGFRTTFNLKVWVKIQGCRNRYYNAIPIGGKKKTSSESITPIVNDDAQPKKKVKARQQKWNMKNVDHFVFLSLCSRRNY